MTIKNERFSWRTGLIKIKFIYIYKSFIYITREVFVRHTVSSNLLCVTHTTYSFWLVTLYLNQSGKSDKRRHSRFSGRSATTTDSDAMTWPAQRWDCRVALDGCAVCSPCIGGTISYTTWHPSYADTAWRMCFGSHGGWIG